MDWMRITQPNSVILVALKMIASASFAILGLLFIFSGDMNQLMEGVVLIVVSTAWLFFTLRNYMKQRVDLESLR
jgi:hypothetical protein